MNIAFPAILIFAIVLPGIIVRHTYVRGFGSWVNPSPSTSLADEVAYSVFFAGVLHLVWMSLLHRCGVSFALKSIVVLLIGAYGKDHEAFEPTLQSIINFPVQIALYFLSISFIGWLLGLSGHFIVRHWHLDIRTRCFRFKNEWFYLLTGEMWSFKELNNIQKPYDAVYMTTVVEQGDATYIYGGIVTKFWFHKNGELDRVLLSMAHRRKLCDDRKPDEDPNPNIAHNRDNHKYYDVDGDYFIIFVSEMQTINVKYVVLPDESVLLEEADQQPTQPLTND